MIIPDMLKNAPMFKKMDPKVRVREKEHSAQTAVVCPSRASPSDTCSHLRRAEAVVAAAGAAEAGDGAPAAAEAGAVVVETSKLCEVPRSLGSRVMAQAAHKLPHAGLASSPSRPCESTMEDRSCSGRGQLRRRQLVRWNGQGSNRIGGTRACTICTPHAEGSWMKLLTAAVLARPQWRLNGVALPRRRRRLLLLIRAGRMLPGVKGHALIAHISTNADSQSCVDDSPERTIENDAARQFHDGRPRRCGGGGGVSTGSPLTTTTLEAEVQEEATAAAELERGGGRGGGGRSIILFFCGHYCGRRSTDDLLLPSFGSHLRQLPQQHSISFLLFLPSCCCGDCADDT